jgi:hypothetical protein
VVLLSESNVWEWFAAALLHDLGKTILDKQGVSSKHEELDVSRSPALESEAERFDFDALLSPGIAAKVRAHHDRIAADSEMALVATVIADRVQKAMHVVRNEEGEVIKDRTDPYQVLRNNPPFYPYYGESVLGWESKTAADVLRNVVSDLEPVAGKLTMDALLHMQRRFRCYPHTSYIPHISLAFHNRFMAVLFYLAYRALSDLQVEGKDHTALKALEFSVLTATPDPLHLFYRLRDVRAHEMAVHALRTGLYDRVFSRHQADLPTMGVDSNPFEFFTGDSLVIVYHPGDVIVDNLRDIVEENPALRSLSVEMVDYRAGLSWNADGSLRFVDPAKVEHPLRESPLVSKTLLAFPRQSLGRCQRCNMPLEEAPEEGGLCKACATLMDRGGVLDLRAVAAGNSGEEATGGKLAYLFVTLPSLKEHAEAIAKEHLSTMKADRVRRGESESRSWAQQLAAVTDLLPTELGIFEYLQAVMEMDAFRLELEQCSGQVYPLARFPELMIYVMREDQFLDFFDVLDLTLADMHLEVSVRAILCGLKTPVWSLMDRFAEHAGSVRALVDTAGGEIVMFTDDEVQAIRDLARFPRWVVTRAQLQALILMARQGSLEELKLEIDRRRKKGKIKGKDKNDFARVLKEKLTVLAPTGSGVGDREKRALFIKNVADLGNFKAQ